MSTRQPWQEALYRAGYEGCVGDEIPDWVDAVWIGYSISRANIAFDAINAAGLGFKNQLDVAHRLGGWEAVRALVDALLAQGEKDMMFDEAVEAADVPQAERAAFRVDVHRAWLAVPTWLEVPTVRAVMCGLLTAEEVEAAQALGGFNAVHGLLVTVGVL